MDTHRSGALRFGSALKAQDETEKNHVPLIRISLLKGRPSAELRTIADCVHEALVETYAVPEGDRFQIIEQLEPDELIFSPDYLDVQRSQRLVLIHVLAGQWRDTGAKRALYGAMADKLERRAGMRREDVQVVISSNDKPDWSFGNGEASYLPRL